MFHELRDNPPISRAFLLRLKRSRTSVRLIPLLRSLASAQMSSAVGSPRLSPNTHRAESMEFSDRQHTAIVGESSARTAIAKVTAE
jgi:hypothetical protein